MTRTSHRGPMGLLILLLIVLPSISSSAARTHGTNFLPRYRPGILFVKFKPTVISSGASSIQSTSAFARIMQRYSVQKTEQPFLKGNPAGVPEEFARIFQLTIPPYYNIETALRELRSDPSIEYAEPDYIRHVTDFTPNDPQYSNQGYLSTIQAQKAWDISKGDTTVVIGIVDTGTDYNHEDLAANIWTNPGETGLDAQGHDKRFNGIDDDGNGFVDDWHGWDFVGASTTGTPDNDPAPKDGNPHGTHTAGIASAATNNGKGIASIGFKTKIMITKHGVDTPGDDNVYSASLGILYCVNNGANIVSCSFGGSGWSNFDQDVIKYALEKNVLVIAAAGNGDSNELGLNNDVVANFPSNYPGVLAVGATTNQDKITTYSNYAAPPTVGVFAPGNDILSTLPNSTYGYFSGTSMSTPMVAGLAALVKAKNPASTPWQIITQLCGTADPIDALNPSLSGKLGYGRINAYRALTETPGALSPRLTLASVAVDDASGGNGNKKLDPGETVKIVVGIANTWGDAANVSATLSTSHWTTSVTQSSASFGTIPGLSNVDGSVVTNQSAPFQISVSADAVPAIVPFSLTVTASGGYTKTFSFNLAISGTVLVVDDDDGINNVEGYTTSALDAIGLSCDVWDHSKYGSPSAALMSSYNLVTWSTEWTVPTLDSTDRAAVTQYLNSGGKLFLSGEENGWDLNAPDGPEYVSSGGASKVFYETYLRSKFVADDAQTANIAGVVNDSIGGGLAFTRNQPGRGDGQNPDVIDTLGGSKAIFLYPDGPYAGHAAGIRYAGSYRLVSLSFGGFESITDSLSRVTVMDRVVRFLTPYSLVVDKLGDTENTTLPYTVTATASSTQTIQSVDLYWYANGVTPYKKVPMSAQGGGKYTASIPAQVANTNLSYFVLVKTVGGFLPHLNYSFHVGPDLIPPVITLLDSIPNSLNATGPFPISATVVDNIGVDTNTVLLNYAVNGGTASTMKLNRVSATSAFSGSLTFAKPLLSGDVVTYFITAADISAAKNQGRYPASGALSFQVGKELLDDFEHGLNSNWSYGSWGLSSFYHATGERHSITDSPSGLYSPNTDNILERLTTYDLSTNSKAELQFTLKKLIDPSDTLYIEASKDGSSWGAVAAMTGLDPAGTPVAQFVRLNGFVGPGSQAIHVRFRMHSDGSAQADGVYLDDITIATDGLTSGVPQAETGIPTAYSLSQNFPNPFNPGTTVEYALPKASPVRLVLYDILGRKVRVYDEGSRPPGLYHVEIDGSDLSSGIYYYTLVAGNFVDTKKMILLK
ncbi:MAG TPA: S8 family serine peptidase [Bacteroidota bacterium]|nr:S8 family serine peptidase [Bacteroidota bacterium]